MAKNFWKAAGIRALRTVAQTAIATIGTTALLEDVRWLTVLSASALAGILSLLTSIATGLPEAQIEERKPPDEEPQIFIKAYDEYYTDGTPKRRGDVVFPETVDGGDDE
jgi:hypothetical protein